VALRVSPTTAVRAEIDALFGSDRELATVLEDVGRLTVRLVLQQAIEAEVDAFLGRARYERRGVDAAPGSRNGWHQPVAVKTTMGPISLSRPKLRDTDEKFCSQLFGLGVTRTNALEALVISSWVRGLSDRDIEAALREALGDEAALSRSTISRICQEIKDEFTAFSTSDLSAHRIDYLFLDGTNFKMHEHAPAEPVLVAWGIDADGKPQLVGLAAATSESTDAWISFLEDLGSRGLASPLLVVSDGAPGLIAAIEHVYPKALRQRCVIHRLRNAVAKVSKADQDMFKSDWWQVFDHIEAPPGQLAVNEATRRLDGFRRRLSCRGLRISHRASPLPRRALEALSAHEPDRAIFRRDTSENQGHRSTSRRAHLRRPRFRGARSPASRLAWHDDDTKSAATSSRSAARAPPQGARGTRRRRTNHSSGISSRRNLRLEPFTPAVGRHLQIDPRNYQRSRRRIRGRRTSPWPSEPGCFC
jgi:transposase-like protein